MSKTEKVKDIKYIKGVREREPYRKDIVRALAERNGPIPLSDLPGWIRDIKELENQGLVSITSDKLASLTEKGKNHVVYGDERN